MRLETVLAWSLAGTLALTWGGSSSLAQAPNRADRKLEALVLRAQQQLARLELESARGLLEAASSQPRYRPSSKQSQGRLFATLGWARSELGDLPGAEKAFRRAVQLDPKVSLPRTSSPKVRATLERIRVIAETDRARRKVAEAGPETAARTPKRKPKRPRTAPKPRRRANSSPKAAPEPTPLEPSARALRPEPDVSPPEPLSGPPSLAEAWSEPPSSARRVPPSETATVTPPSVVPATPTTTWGPALNKTEVWGLVIGGTLLTAGVITLAVVLSQGESCGEAAGCPDMGTRPLLRF